MKTAHKIVFGLIVLIFITFGGCSEDSSWNTNVSGLPMSSGGQTGESRQAPTGTDELTPQMP